MDTYKGTPPNLTLEEAIELISRWQSRCHKEEASKKRAQAVAFELLSKDLHIREEDLKARMFYLQEELNRSIKVRDRVKAELEEARAEITLLKTKLKISNFPSENT